MDASQSDGCYQTTTITSGKTTTTTTTLSLGPGAEIRTKMMSVTIEPTISKRTRWKAQLEIAGWVGAISTTHFCLRNKSSNCLYFQRFCVS